MEPSLFLTALCVGFKSLWHPPVAVSKNLYGNACLEEKKAQLLGAICHCFTVLTLVCIIRGASFKLSNWGFGLEKRLVRDLTEYLCCSAPFQMRTGAS